MKRLTHKERLQYEADRHMRYVNIGLDLVPVDKQMQDSVRVVTKWNLRQYYKYKDLVDNYDKYFPKENN